MLKIKFKNLNVKIVLYKLVHREYASRRLVCSILCAHECLRAESARTTHRFACKRS